MIKADGVDVDQIRIVLPEQDKSLEPLNGSIFRRKDPYGAITEVESPRVIQGFIETSNVNVVDQMMEMITLEKIYTINSKVIQTRDGTLARAMDLGKPTQ
jgi:flagellar basal-body rod protein FlgG